MIDKLKGFLNSSLEKGSFSQSPGGFSNEPIEGLSDLYVPEQQVQAPVQHRRDVADVLFEMKLITSEQLARIRKDEQQKPNIDISLIILSYNMASGDDILMAKAKLCNLDFRKIAPDEVDKEVFDKLGIDYVKRNRIMPVAIKGDKVLVATSCPGDVYMIDDVKRRVESEITVVVCHDDDIEQVCDAFSENSDFDYCLDDIITDMTALEIVHDEEEDSLDLEKIAGQSPIIKFVNYLIGNAISSGASDIHIEPKEQHTNIRYRIDGALFESLQCPAKMHPAVTSRIKIMANLDISERRLPQDGKISVIANGRGIDLRVSTLPTRHGEKVVIRVLDSESIMRGLDQCGMEAELVKEFRNQIKQPHGILLVTGPTGSGKSTTLYSALGEMDGNTMNISTVEDPIEYELGFTSQVQVRDKIGMTFAAALRSLLRQDPDIIMIGEIRDAETAHIATQAALTGHLVLSTLHTNDAPSSITRLANIGIEPYLIAASLNGVLAQRLVRKICDECKEPYEPSAQILKYIKSEGIETQEFYHGKGCDKCRDSGYSGRLGIYELLVIEEKFREQITKDVSINNMRKIFQQTGSKTLFDDGINKVKQGLTTVEEVLKVTQAYDDESEE